MTPREPAAPRSGTLLEEVRQLDTIRSALRSGDLQSATRGLQHYDQRFPRGELGREKAVLGVDLLVASGQRERARTRARQLLEQPGMQRYAAHLRSISQGSTQDSTQTATPALDARTPESGSEMGDAHIRGRR